MHGIWDCRHQQLSSSPVWKENSVGSDRGSIEFTALDAKLNELADTSACMRAVVRRTADGWELHHMTAIVGFTPEDWRDQTWQYEELAFIACRVPASALAGLFVDKRRYDPAAEGADSALADKDEPNHRVLVLGSLHVAVPAASGPAQWTREPSFARHERSPLPRPTTKLTIASREPGRSVPHSVLVAQWLPSFPESSSAWRAFNESDYSLAGAPTVPHELAVIRIAAQDGWIGRVRVSATQLIVETKGYELAGCELEVYGVTGRANHPLDGPTTLRLALDHGLPEDAWLWLKRGTRWLDYRSIHPQSGWTGDLAAAGVEIEEPVDPSTKIEALLSVGEGPQVEYKEKLVKSGDDRRNLKTIPAFANENGGTIVFGMHQDELTRVGVEDGDRIQQRDQLVNLIRAAVEPTPKVNVSAHVLDDKTFFIVEVAPGLSPPYGLILSGSARDKPEYYVRRGASTYPARPGDIHEIVRTRVLQDVQATSGRWQRGIG